MDDPNFKYTRLFEKALCDYTGAPYCAVTNSCTAAIRLSLKWWVGTHKPVFVEMPAFTYKSVPEAVLWAGCNTKFCDYKWAGAYPLTPTEVVDAARRFRKGMFKEYEKRDRLFMCVCFHPKKQFPLANGGGAILHNDGLAQDFFEWMRHDGRVPGYPEVINQELAMKWYNVDPEHCLMMEATAAEGLDKLAEYARVDIHPDWIEDQDKYLDMRTLPEVNRRLW